MCEWLDSKLVAIAEQLLGVGACTYPRGGDPGAKPMPAPLTPYAPSGARTRGIYCTLPRGEEEPAEARRSLARGTSARERRATRLAQVRAVCEVSGPATRDGRWSLPGA